MAPVQERWVERDTWLLLASCTRCVLWEVMEGGDAMRGLLLCVQGTGAEPFGRIFNRHMLCARSSTCIIFFILTVAVKGGTLIPI